MFVFTLSPVSQGSPVRLWYCCGEGCAVRRRGICERGVTSSCFSPVHITEDTVKLMCKVCVAAVALTHSNSVRVDENSHSYIKFTHSYKPECFQSAVYSKEQNSSPEPTSTVHNIILSEYIYAPGRKCTSTDTLTLLINLEFRKVLK